MDNKNVQSYQGGNEHSELTREGGGDLFVIGQWYWYRHGEFSYRPEDHITRVIDGENYCLLCLVHIGSNVVELTEPKGGDSRSSTRMLYRDAVDMLIHEPDYQNVIQQHIDQQNLNTKLILTQMAGQAKKFGLNISKDVGHFVNPNALPSPPSSGTGLAVLADVLDIAAFKQDMVVFQKTTLPAMQQQLKNQCQSIAKWAAAVALLPSVMIDQMKEDMSSINDKIEDISLYAGIDEEMTLVKDGAAASADQAIHIMQRKLYMDEECLFDYDAGGMSFKDIKEFDAWICRHGNFERMFPFAKTVVAFQVRRNRKEYENNLSAFITISLHKLDKRTVLYVRNGEQLYRVSNDIQFDSMIFPSDQGLLNEPIMVKAPYGRVKDVITVREYEQVKAHIDRHGLAAAYKECGYHIADDIHQDQYQPFHDQNIYFDEINQHFTNILKQYNKVSVIVQGILDRSVALSPHPRINLANPADFMNHIRLIYDAENVLYAGDKPDFEAYRKSLNEQITDDSVLVGQYEAFIRRETEKENERRLQSRYNSELCEINRYVPNNNPGPGQISLAAKVMKTGKAIFTWERESADWRRMIKDKITVPFSELLNASAYRKGDYKCFFADPRTREEYLEWAPFLLKAEDYAAGKESAAKPV